MSSKPSNIGDLTDKIALITGASSGIGRAIAEAYASAGAFVVSADLIPNAPVAPTHAETQKDSGADTSTATVELLNQKYSSTTSTPRASFVKCDVSSTDSFRDAVAFTVKKYGRLDIMVNNAGIAAATRSKNYESGAIGRLHELEDDVLDKDFAVNVRGVWLGIKYAAIQMLKQPPHASGDRGWIINMCSVLSFVALPNTASYIATKGAALQLTKAAALDYANDRIHINGIAPGFVDTAILDPVLARGGEQQGEATRNRIDGLHPWGRMGKPQEIASMAVFLAGPGASFCTGQVYAVDGGYTAQ